MDLSSNLSSCQRHKIILEQYVLKKNKIEKRDIDIIRENHKFIWNENLSDNELTWREKLARKYYNRLFKEYCICDLTKYKENKIAMRWRTEKEVLAGKGQFFCGHKHCNKQTELFTWELNFAYVESGEKKNALVKLKLCNDCSAKLNYRSQKRQIKRAEKNSKVKLKSNRLENPNRFEKTDEEILEKDEIQTCETYEEPTLSTDENIDWTISHNDDACISRETEFEKYLEDLLL